VPPMVKNLVTKSEFARSVGVSAGAVTKACGSGLKAAIVGGRIDIDHPAAIEYRNNQARGQLEPAVTGMDPLYESTVAWCVANGCYSVSGVKRGMKIGHTRSQKLVTLMRVNGMIPEPLKTRAKDPAPKPFEKVPVVNGYNARNERIKRESAENPDDLMDNIPKHISKLADKSLRELVHMFGTDRSFKDWLDAAKKIEDIDTTRIKNAQLKGELVNKEFVKISVVSPIESAHVQLLTDGAKTITRKVIVMCAAENTPAEIEKEIIDQLASFIRPVKTKITRALKNV